MVKFGMIHLYSKKPGADDFHPKSPGMKYKHYAPKAAVRIVEGSKSTVSAAIAELETEAVSNNMKTAVLDYMGNGDKAANNFFLQISGSAIETVWI